MTWKALKFIALIFAALFITGSAQATKYYVDATSGSDSNDGQSTATPWQHAPGMRGCSGNCAAANPQPGDSFIFKGGVTWGNATMCWDWTWSGTSGNPIYIGVDQSWFAGGSWTRPILNGNGAVTGACSAHPGSGNDFFVADADYIDFDNFEFTGGIWGKATDFSAVSHHYWISQGTRRGLVVENNYMHGWSNSAINCDGCDPAAGIEQPGQTGGFAPPGTITARFNVIDGSDSPIVQSDPNCTGACLAGMQGMIGNFDLAYGNVIRYTSQGIDGSMTTLHDNLIEHIRGSVNSNSGAHSNGFESQNGCNGSWYNNVVRHTMTPRGVNTFSLSTQQGCTNFAFNNVVYDTSQGNCFDVFANGTDRTTPRGTQTVFNNTVSCGPDGNVGSIPVNGIDCSSLPYVSCTLENNHFITNASSMIQNLGANMTQGSHNILQTVAQASGQGYTTSETFALSPNSASGKTVGAGGGISSFCSAVAASSAAAGTACASDATFGPSYDTTAHTATCCARTTAVRPGTPDVGAYQLKPGGPAPNPPTGLAATIQ